MKKRMYQSPEVDFKLFQASDILLASADIDLPGGVPEEDDDIAINGGYDD